MSSRGLASATAAGTAAAKNASHGDNRVLFIKPLFVVVNAALSTLQPFKISSGTVFPGKTNTGGIMTPAALP
jgi:hypothetical protein